MYVDQPAIRPDEPLVPRSGELAAPAVVSPAHPVDLDEHVDGATGGAHAGATGQAVGEPPLLCGVECLVAIPVEKERPYRDDLGYTAARQLGDTQQIAQHLVGLRSSDRPQSSWSVSTPMVPTRPALTPPSLRAGPNQPV